VWTLTDAHFEHAARAVSGVALRTPLVRAPQLGALAYVKCETQQHTRSFKVRGAISRLAALTPEERTRGVVAASAGNHGLGVAWAGRALGVRATVVVPKTSPRVTRDGIAALGAEVLVRGDGYDDAEDFAKALATERGAVFVSPYDDPFVAAGNGGTLADELRDVPGLATIVLPLGGGGLAIGVATRLAGRFTVIAVQSDASPAMRLSLDRGAAITRYVGAPTLAEGLEGGVSETAYAHVRDLALRVELVDEPSIAEAMRFSRDVLGETLEGSAAVGIAWARAHAAALDARGPWVVVLTGANVEGSPP